MPHIVFVHGISSNVSPAKLLSRWHAALAAESGIQLDQFGCTSKMVYWADVLYSDPLVSETVGADAEAAAETADGEEALAQIAQATAMSPEQAMFIAGLTGKYAAIAMQTVANEKCSLPPAARADERMQPRGALKTSLMATFLRDVHHYLFNSPRTGRTHHVQEEIRRRFVKALRDRANVAGPSIVVSHGVGSVIAYDCLMRVADCPAVDGLMTIGSPLGFDEIQGKLQPGWSRENGFPARTLRGRWINVFDSLDPVAGFDPRLAYDFQNSGQLVINDIVEPNSGLWRHDIEKYLAGSQMRAALQSMLRPTEAARIPVAVRRRGTPKSKPTVEKTVSISPNSEPGSPKSPIDIEFEGYSPQHIHHEFAIAIYNSRHRRVAQIADFVVRRLNHHQELYDETRAKELLSLLRRKRYFKQMIQVADALIQSGMDKPHIRRQYAQALIDRAQGMADAGTMTAALSILQGIINKGEDDKEINEARGLIGRINKQLYVNAANDGAPKIIDRLTSALDAYYDVYDENPKEFAWHGINTAALLSRANRDGLAHQLDPRFPKYEALAQQILADVSVEENRDRWRLATAAEAYIALGKLGKATDLIQKYCRDNEVDAFELGSFLRQLKEVWQFSPENEQQGQILAVVQTELMQRQGCQMTLSAADMPLLKLANEGKLEKVFGPDSYKPLAWLITLLERCKCVARIANKMGRCLGTGFVVHGGDFHPQWHGQFYVLTNAHVISDDTEVQPALRSDRAQISFECWLGHEKKYDVAKIVWSSPPGKFDATLVELSPKLTDCVGHEKWLGVKSDQKGVYLIGHPLGLGLSISLHDNKFLGYYKPKLYYRTPSEPGSSGSPVFDENWDFIGLHRAGSFEMPNPDGSQGNIEANEGLSLEEIRSEIGTTFGGGKPNR
jgi:hypothetical protein